MDETKAVITLTKAALEFIYSDRSIDEAWSDYEESALELYDNESDQSADEFLDQARLIFHDSVDARLKELKKHSRFTDNAVAKPEKTPTEHSQTGAEIAAAVIAVMVSNPDNSVDGYIKLFGEALPKIKAAIQQSATGSKILPDPLLALTRLKPLPKSKMRLISKSFMMRRSSIPPLVPKRSWWQHDRANREQKARSG
jgi:hypothetical protein